MVDQNPQHDAYTCTRRIKTWRALGITADGDAEEVDTYDSGPVPARERDALGAARAMLDEYPCAIVEAGTAWWSESDGKLDDDMETVAVFGNRAAALAGGWID